MTGITKTFGAFSALDDVSLSVRKGSIHAIVGENGAGKTTLMKVLQGQYVADSGTTEVKGQEVHFHKAAHGLAAGIGMVSQHYSIIPELTCLQNLMLGAEGSFVIDHNTAIERANQIAQEMGFAFDWDAPAGGLSTAQGQKLEILKLRWRSADIMILDEPTAMLSPMDSDALFESLKMLVADGKTVIVVTHRIAEVLGYCEDVTVLRGGKFITSRAVEGLQAADLAELIVGHSVASHDLAAFDGGDPVLNVSRLSVAGERGTLALKDVNLQLRAGEVVGLAGVDGNGQRELMQAVLGVQKAVSGDISVASQTVTQSSVADRLAQGVAYIPEDRFAEGIIADWSLADNSILGIQRTDEVQEKGWLKRGTVMGHADRTAARFRTKFRRITDPIRSLSGGNQQRFVAGRVLESRPKVILAFQPTRGLDIDATENVYSGIREHCRTTGAVALVVSFDLDELLDQCDRVVAINQGVLREPPKGHEKDRAVIGRLMVDE